MRREIKTKLSTFEKKWNCLLKKEQKALQAQIELLKSKNISLKLQLHKFEGNAFNTTEQPDLPKTL